MPHLWTVTTHYIGISRNVEAIKVGYHIHRAFVSGNIRITQPCGGRVTKACRLLGFYTRPQPTAAETYITACLVSLSTHTNSSPLSINTPTPPSWFTSPLSWKRRTWKKCKWKNLALSPHNYKDLELNFKAFVKRCTSNPEQEKIVERIFFRRRHVGDWGPTNLRVYFNTSTNHPRTALWGK